MKKIICILLLLLGMTFPALAAEPEESTVPESEPVVSEPAVSESAVPEKAFLQIDTAHRFPGMNSAYESGYIPAVEDGCASIFLPLTCTAPLKNDEILVSLDLGPQAADAFVAANYEKSFILSEVKPEGEKASVKIFPVAFLLSLLEERLNGVYPVTVHGKGADLQGIPVEFSYTVFITVRDGKSKNPPEPTLPEPEKPTAEPVVYISDSALNPAVVQAGELFTWTVTLKNSLKTKSLQNLLVTIDLGSEQVDLLEKGNVIAAGDIEAGGEEKLTLHFQADPAIAQGKHSLNLHFRYDSPTSLGLSADGTCVFTVRQPVSLSFDGVNLPVKVFTDDTVTIPVNLMNTGKASLYNCRIDYEIEGLQSGGTTFVGELASGESKTGNGNLLAKKIGPVKGNVIITYEDAYGEIYTQTAEVSTTIEEKPEPVKEEPKGEKKPSLWWLWGILGLAAGAGLSAGISWIIRDKKQRKEDDLRL